MYGIFEGNVVYLFRRAREFSKAILIHGMERYELSDIVLHQEEPMVFFVVKDKTGYLNREKQGQLEPFLRIINAIFEEGT